eukprot:scaffold42428_cov49-Phaeocystis_antarctica.AAC.2
MNVDHGLGAARTLTSPIKQGPRAVSNPDAVKRAQAHRLLTGHGSLAARRGENCTNENNSADTTCTCATCTGRAQHRWLAQQEKSRPESPVNDTDDLSTDAAPAAAERPRTAPEAAVPAGANRKARASFLPKKGIFSRKSSSSQELGSDSVRVAGDDSPARAIREDAANQLQLGGVGLARQIVSVRHTCARALCVGAARNPIGSNPINCVRAQHGILSARNEHSTGRTHFELALL